MLGVGCFRHWFPIMLDLHRFKIAVARVSVNHDGKGGTDPDPLVWDQGSKPKVRKLAIRVNVDLASLPGPLFKITLGFRSLLVALLVPTLLLGHTVLVFCLDLLLFLLLLHWPSGTQDFGHFGISFLELLIFFEQWAGHRLLSEKDTRPHVRAHRPILIPSVPVSEGIEIRHGCQFVRSLVRALSKLPGGLGRFLPCSLGSHMSRLRHLGWNQCSHGLSSRPLESFHHQCLKAVCSVLEYPSGAAAELLDGTEVFTTRFPLGLYPGLDEGSKSVRLTTKTRPGASSHDIPDPGHPTPRRWKRLRPPSSKGEGGEVGVPRNLFPRLGVG